MGFFSTASRSPRAGTATIGLTNFLTDLGRLEQEERRVAGVKAQATRNQQLSESLLGLKDFDKKGITAWALENKVSATELDNLKPIFEQRKTKEEPAKYGKVQKDKVGEYQIGPKGKKEYTYKFSTTTGKQYGKVQKDEIGEFQFGPTGKKEYTHKFATDGTKTQDPTKIPDWYNKMTGEATRAYFGDNMEPTEVQRSNYDRAITRAQTRTYEMMKQYNVTGAEAYPVAMLELRKETAMSEDISEGLPVANTGFNSNKEETTQIVRQMQTNGLPPYLIGESLREKGWDDKDTTDILKMATTLKSAKEVGINLEKLKKNMPKEGGSVKIDGKIWFRNGNYLIDENGIRVSIQ